MTATLLAVSIVDAEPPLHEQVADALRAGADLIELRVDRIGDVAAVEELLRQPHDQPFIVTVRCAAEGGAWGGGERERLRVIERLASLAPGYVDVEAAVARRPAIGGNRLILSHHDLAATPADPGAVLDRLAGRGADVIKAAFTAADALDALRVLDALRQRAGRCRTIALAMGEAGLVSRVLARKFGAFLTFAAPRPGSASAPGQITVSELRQRYRWNTIGRATRLFGVIGWPVAHSRGPQLHNAALAAADLDGVYLPMPVKPSYADLATFLDYVSAEPWRDLRGLSVTIPHKEHVARWLARRGDTLSPLAARCGAVNTLVRTPGGRWRGANTDALGVVAAIENAAEPAAGELRGVAVDVLGAGGVARAAVAALVDRGCTVTIYNRSPERAARLADELGCRCLPWERRADGAGRVLINCTSVGMTPHTARTPMPRRRLAPPLVVFDTVYTPRQTRLLREAAAAGCTTIDGETLFVAQAAAQFSLWHDRPAPVGAMRAALDAPHG